MNEPEYRTLVTLLESAKLVLARNAGDLNPADHRIRCLVNITSKEVQRALESNVSTPFASAAPAGGGDDKGEIVSYACPPKSS